MPLKTTTIGSYPKPEYLKVPDWFKLDKTGIWGTLKEHEDYYGKVNLEGNSLAIQSGDVLSKVEWNAFPLCVILEHKKIVDRAKQEVMPQQAELGIDVITDGEVERENYVFHFL